MQFVFICKMIGRGGGFGIETSTIQLKVTVGCLHVNLILSVPSTKFAENLLSITVQK